MSTHRFDVTSFVLGLVVVAVAVAYLVGEYTDLRISAAWLFPAALIGLGVAGLLAGVSRSVRSREAAAPAAVDPRA
jgi:hypothetical protein